jgi:hypothetical protein
MTITLDLQPEIERALLARATARGLSLSELLSEIVVREARVSPEQLPRRTGQELIDACAKLRGLLSDEELTRSFAEAPPLPAPSISSEPLPEPRVKTWVAAQDLDILFISFVNFGKLRKRAVLLSPGSRSPVAFCQSQATAFVPAFRQSAQ